MVSPLLLLRFGFADLSEFRCDLLTSDNDCVEVPSPFLVRTAPLLGDRLLGEMLPLSVS